MQSAATSFLDANLRWIDPRTAQLLSSGWDDRDVRIDTSGSAPRVTVLGSTGSRLSLHDADDPRPAAQLLVTRLAEQGPPEVLVVIGIGLGEVLDALEQSTLSTKVLAIEPFPGVARAMLARRDWAGWLATGRLKILVGPDYVGSTEAWSLFDRPRLTPGVVMAPALGREFPDAAQRAKEVVGQILGGARANDEARSKFAGRYLHNTLRNLPTIAAEGDAGTLVGAFPRVPAVVIGAGPSLDRNLEHLSTLATHALLIAVDTALRPLLAAGIHPHVVVAVDPSEINARHLSDLPDTRGVWLVSEGSIDPTVLPAFAQRTFTFKVSDHEPWPWLAEHGLQRHRLRAWGSVLTTAFDLAIEAGCDPIVFAGADLAYSGCLPYCRNTAYETEWAHLPTDAERAEEMKRSFATNPTQVEKDVNRQDVRTTPLYVQFRDWIVARAAQADDRTVLNGTGAGILHGAKIAQTSVERLARSCTDVYTPAATHHRLAEAWARNVDSRIGPARRLEHALTTNTLPMEAWERIVCGSPAAKDIAGTIALAGDALATHNRLAQHLSSAKARIDSAATTVDEARAIIHPDYDWACQQAVAQQAHVVLEVSQRLYPATRGTTTAEVVHAASMPPHALRVLDFGCGLGRMMEPLIQAGHSVDGVDSSARMIALARHTNPALRTSELFQSQGTDCGGAVDGAYDVVSVFHTLHEVTPRQARLEILRAIARALRPGGVIVVQLPFFPGPPDRRPTGPFLPWSAELPFVDPVNAPDGSVWPTPDELTLIYRDFSRWFCDIRLQFVDFPDTTRRFGLAPDVPLCHLIISGSTATGLARRIYSPIEEPAGTAPAGA